MLAFIYYYLNTTSDTYLFVSYYINCSILYSFFFFFFFFSRYTPAARLSEVVYDSTLVTFTYDDASGTVKTIHLTHNGFISSIRYRQTGTTHACTLNTPAAARFE